MRRSIANVLLAALAIAPLTGCVSIGRYDEAVADASQERGQKIAFEERSKALAAQVEALSTDLKARDAKLEEESLELSNAKKTSDDALATNTELSLRLKNAAQAVEQLASERGNLSIALADVKKKLDEAIRLETAAEARATEARAAEKEALAKLAVKDETIKTKIVAHKGRPSAARELRPATPTLPTTK